MEILEKPISRRALIGGSVGVAALMGAMLASSRLAPYLSKQETPKTIDEFFQYVSRPKSIPHSADVSGYLGSIFNMDKVVSPVMAAGSEAVSSIVDTFNNVRIELTFVDENVIPPNMTFSEFWGPACCDSKEEVESYPWCKGYLVQYTGFGTIYDVGLADEYVIIGCPSMVNGVSFDISDVNVAADNEEAIMFDGVRFDKDTGIVYVAKSNFGTADWQGCKVQLMLRTTLERLQEYVDIPCSVTSCIPDVTASPYTLAFGYGVDPQIILPLVATDDAAKISADDIEIYISGMDKRFDFLIPNDSILYDNETGFLLLPMSSLAVPGLDIVIRRPDDVASGNILEDVVSSVLAPREASAKMWGATYTGYVSGNHAAVSFDLKTIQNGRFWRWGFLEYKSWLDNAVNRLFSYKGIALNVFSDGGGGYAVMRGEMKSAFPYISYSSYVFPVIAYMFDYEFAVNTLGLPPADQAPDDGMPSQSIYDRPITNIVQSSLGEIWKYLEPHWLQGCTWEQVISMGFGIQYGRIISLPSCDVAFNDGYPFKSGGGQCGDARFWSTIYNYHVQYEESNGQLVQRPEWVDYDTPYDKARGDSGYIGKYNSATGVAAACCHIENPTFLQGEATGDGDYYGDVYARILEMNKGGGEDNSYVILGMCTPQLGSNSQACQAVIKVRLRYSGYARVDKKVSM